MAKKLHPTLISLLVVFALVIIVLPILRRNYRAYFPEGFRTLDCQGVICGEGEFCQENKCQPVMPAITNNYFDAAMNVLKSTLPK